jgi:hypothetical protein
MLVAQLEELVGDYLRRLGSFNGRLDYVGSERGFFDRGGGPGGSGGAGSPGLLECGDQ